jgi:hypothetical protein
MKKTLIAVLMLFSIAGVANATLQRIGTATYGGSDYKLIYDVEDQLTWLDYSNTGATHPGSLAWAASLNNPGVLTINLDEGYTTSWESTAWRLAGNTAGYFSANPQIIYSSEMEDLYYNELGNVLNDTSLNFGDFENLSGDYYHMSADAALAAQLGLSFSPRFLFFNGIQEFGTSSVNGSGIRGMAVIPGAVVPEPATLALLGLGGFLLRKRK